MTTDNPPTLTLTAPADAAGARLDKWLAEAGTGMSRSRLRVLIEEGRVTINGQPALLISTTDGLTAWGVAE